MFWAYFCFHYITAPTKKESEYQVTEYPLNRKKTNYEDLTLKKAYECYINSKSAVLSPSAIAGYKRCTKRLKC